jgi:hypothetical protein
MKILSGQIKEDLKQEFLARLPGGDGQPYRYLLIWAVKPGETIKTTPTASS